MNVKQSTPARLMQTLYPVTVIVSGMLFYLLATGRTGWYCYVLLGFLVLDRTLIAFIQWAANMMMKKVSENMMAMMAAAQARHAMPDDPTLGPIHGGAIDPPENDD